MSVVVGGGPHVTSRRPLSLTVEACAHRQTWLQARNKISRGWGGVGLVELLFLQNSPLVIETLFRALLSPSTVGWDKRAATFHLLGAAGPSASFFARSREPFSSKRVTWNRESLPNCHPDRLQIRRDEDGLHPAGRQTGEPCAAGLLDWAFC